MRTPNSPGNRNRRFYAEAHAGLQWLLISLYHITPFMSVQSNAMTGAVWQSGKLISGPETGVCYDFSGCCVYHFTSVSYPGRSKTGSLCFLFQFPDINLSLGWFCSKYNGPGDIGTVSVYSCIRNPLIRYLLFLTAVV